MGRNGRAVRHGHAPRPRRRGFPPTHASATCSPSSGEVISAVVVAHELRADGRRGRARSPAPRPASSPTACFGDARGRSTSTRRACSRRIDAGRRARRRRLPGRAPRRARRPRSAAAARDTTACALGVALERRGGRDLHRRRRRHDRRPARVRRRRGARRRSRPTSSSRWRKHGAQVVHTPAAELALRERRAGARAQHVLRPLPARSWPTSRRTAPASVATAVSHVDGVARVRVSAARPPEGTRRTWRRRRASTARMADAGVSPRHVHALRRRRSCSRCRRPTLRDAMRVLDRLGHAVRGHDRAREGHARRRGHARRTRRHGAHGRVAARRAGVDVLQTADTHTTISVLVPQDRRERPSRAARRLRPGESAAVRADGAVTA